MARPWIFLVVLVGRRSDGFRSGERDEFRLEGDKDARLATADPAEDVHVGDHVRIEGLSITTRWNGMHGIVQYHNATKGRWVVAIRDTDGDIRQVGLKPENLVVERGLDTLFTPACEIVNCAECHDGLINSCKICNPGYVPYQSAGWKCQTCSALTCGSFTTKWGCENGKLACDNLMCSWSGNMCEVETATAIQGPFPGRCLDSTGALYDAYYTPGHDTAESCQAVLATMSSVSGVRGAQQLSHYDCNILVDDGVDPRSFAVSGGWGGNYQSNTGKGPVASQDDASGWQCWTMEAHTSAPMDCVDIEPPSDWPRNTCQKQQEGGHCDAKWFMDTGFCLKTCGRCPAHQAICVDVNEWADSYGITCRDYVDKSYCTSNGDYGSGWRSEWESFEKWANNGHTAVTACCGCGGRGQETSPTTPAAPASIAWEPLADQYCFENWRAEWAAHTNEPLESCKSKCVASASCIAITFGSNKLGDNNCVLCSSLRTMSITNVKWDTYVQKATIHWEQHSNNYCDEKWTEEWGSHTNEPLESCKSRCVASPSCVAITFGSNKFGSENCVICSSLRTKSITNVKWDMYVKQAHTSAPMDCVDIEPPSDWPWNTCQKQQEGGHCDAKWFMDTGFCLKTCGRCPALQDMVKFNGESKYCASGSLTSNGGVDRYSAATATTQGCRDACLSQPLCTHYTSGPSPRWGHPGDCLLYSGDCDLAEAYRGLAVTTYRLQREVESDEKRIYKDDKSHTPYTYQEFLDYSHGNEKKAMQMWETSAPLEAAGPPDGFTELEKGWNFFAGKDCGDVHCEATLPSTLEACAAICRVTPSCKGFQSPHANNGFHGRCVWFDVVPDRTSGAKGGAEDVAYVKAEAAPKMIEWGQ